MAYVGAPLATKFTVVTKVQTEAAPTELTAAAMADGRAMMQAIVNDLKVYPPELESARPREPKNPKVRMRMIERTGEVQKVAPRGTYVRTGQLGDSWFIVPVGTNALQLVNNAIDKWGRFYAVLVHGGFTAKTTMFQTSFHRRHGWRNAYLSLQRFRYQFGSQGNLRTVLRREIVKYLGTTRA